MFITSFLSTVYRSIPSLGTHVFLRNNKLDYTLISLNSTQIRSFEYNYKFKCTRKCVELILKSASGSCTDNRAATTCIHRRNKNIRRGLTCVAQRLRVAGSSPRAKTFSALRRMRILWHHSVINRNPIPSPSWLTCGCTRIESSGGPTLTPGRNAFVLAILAKCSGGSTAQLVGQRPPGSARLVTIVAWVA